MKEIDVKDLQKVLKDKSTSHIVIDVRTPSERTESRISGTLNIPMSRVKEQLDLLKNYDSVYVHCGSGGRSSKVCTDLEDLGLTNTVNIKGGMAAWDEHGFSVMKHGNISILRQVRIMAGILVIIGLALGYFVNDAYLLISLFIASGLIFAGVTNNCGMAALLLKMPWNKL